MTTTPHRTHWLDATPKPKPGLVVQPVGGETIVYDPAADALHRLEPTATAVWDRLDGVQSVRAIAADLAAAYAMREEVIRQDVGQLITVLHDQGLLAGSSGPPASTGHRPQHVGGSPSVLGNGPIPRAAHVTRLFRGLEHAFEIATNDHAVRDYLDRILADLVDGGGTEVTRYELIALSDTRHVVRYEDQIVVDTGGLDRALAVLLWHVNAEVVRRSTPRYPLLHAAGAVRNGAAVVLAAAPERGKTTTVAGLVAHGGFQYLSDEAVAIDPDTLRARPYPKPLSIDRGSWDVLSHLRPADGDWVTGQWQVPASSIRDTKIAQPAPIRFVVEPAYDPTCVTQLEAVPPAAMLVRLADSTFEFSHAPQRNLTVLARVVEEADCYRLPISDLGAGVGLIKDLFG